MCLQDTDAEQPVTEEPSMQQKVKKLKGQFPHVSYERLQNLLAAHEGCIIKTSRVGFSSHSTFAAGALNWVGTYNIGDDTLQHPSCWEVVQYTE